MALEAWYDVDDGEPTVIGTVDDADALFGRMAVDAARFDIPQLTEFFRHDADNWAVAYFGVNVKNDRGIVTHSDPSGSVISVNDIGTIGAVTYDYMGHLRELPANAEVPMADVRQAMREFITTNGARPTSVSWQVSG
jgi:hypothetical protein